ncbi:MAG: acylphosphatase [Candidatus Doudnabacteria bacterium]|nr:acylphosphatase [Candidatus Doudnabacteria bacterium]
MRHLNIKVYGRVIDVDFRHAAKRLAESLGITGFARNAHDGTVFMEAEGEEEALAQFTDWCKVGSKYARVDKIEVSGGELKGFRDFKRI